MNKDYKPAPLGAGFVLFVALLVGLIVFVLSSSSCGTFIPTMQQMYVSTPSDSSNIYIDGLWIRAGSGNVPIIQQIPTHIQIDQIKLIIFPGTIPDSLSVRHNPQYIGFD